MYMCISNLTDSAKLGLPVNLPILLLKATICVSCLLPFTCLGFTLIKIIILLTFLV